MPVQRGTQAQRTARRAAPLAASMALALVLFALLASVSATSRAGAEEAARSRASRQLTPYATALAAAIDRPMTMLAGLHDFVEVEVPAGISRERFDTFAAGLSTRAAGVRAIQLAPDGVVTFVYPLAGNVVGNNLLTDTRPEVAEDISRTLDSDAIVISGPYELRQGGLGLVGRQAVHNTDGSLWGLAIVVLDMPPVLETVGLDEAPSGLRYAVRDDRGRVFAGDAAVFDESPVILDVGLVDGSWEIAALPAEGWAAASRGGEAGFWTVAVVAVAALCSIVYLLMTQQRRLQAEVAVKAELIHSQGALLERVAETSPVGIVLLGMDGAISFANAAAEEILDLTRSDIAARAYDDPSWAITALDGGPFPHEELPFTRVAATGGPVTDVRHAIETHDGRRRALSINAAPLRNAAGEMTGVVASILDITESVRAEEALRRSERLLHSSMDDMIEGCQIIGFDWTYLYLNRAAAVQNRRPNAELLGRRFTDVWPGIERTAIHRELKRCLEERESRSVETEFEFPDGVVRWFDLSVQPVPEGVLILSMDVTESREQRLEIEAYRDGLERLVEERTGQLMGANERLEATNRELDNSNEELQAANAVLEDTTRELEETNRELHEATAAKSTFLAKMSHELRTPLNSIIGFSQLLASGIVGPLSDEQVKQIEIINQSGHHLLSLINDVLDLSKVEAGAVEIHREELAPDALLREVAEAIRPLAESAGLTLSVDATWSGGRLIADRGKVKQVLLNLAGNAVKFTEAGTIAMGLERDPLGRIGFAVHDTGRGIPQAEITRMFEPFAQLESADSMLPQGTGLGLTISREYATMLGGEIHVTSTIGEGSTFTLWLPSE